MKRLFRTLKLLVIATSKTLSTKTTAVLLLWVVCSIFLELTPKANAVSFNNYSLFSWQSIPATTSDSIIMPPGESNRKIILSWNDWAQVPGEWMTIDEYNAYGSSQITSRVFRGSFSSPQSDIKEIMWFEPEPGTNYIEFPRELIICLHPNTTNTAKFGTIRLEGVVVYTYNDRSDRVVNVSYEWNYKQISNNILESFKAGEISSALRLSGSTCIVESISPASIDDNAPLSYQWQQKSPNSNDWTPMQNKTTASISVNANDLISGNILRREAKYYTFNKYSNECSIIVIGSPSNEHYIKRSAYNYMPGSQIEIEEQSISYYDAWGRVRQQVEVAASTDGKDIITHFEYDHLGRQAKSFLPYAENTTSQLRTNAATAQSAFYSTLFPGETHPYSEKIFENSSLERIKAVYNVGKVFRTNDKKQTVVYDIAINAVRKLTYDPEWRGFTVSGTHPKLLVSSSTNEDGQSVNTYTDGWGRTVANCTEIENGEAAWTLYLYDAKGRLLWVVSPEAAAHLIDRTYRSEDDLLKQYCYMYTYSDFRDRMIAKRLPGAEPVQLIYDMDDRLVGVQDGNQRTRNEWTLTSYDNLGRIIEQWTAVKSGVENSLTTHTFASLISGATSKTKLLAYGYDTYPGNALSFETVNGVVESTSKDTRTKGLKTYEWIRLIGTGAQVEAIERTFFYDKQARVIQTAEKNHRGRVSRYSSRLDFVGNILVANELHDVELPVDFPLTTTNVFDHRGRMLSSTSKAYNSPEAKTTYSYNSIGQLIEKVQGNVIHVYYSNNIQGWLTQITGNFFTEKLKYYDSEISTTTPLYSGNISEMRWKNRFQSYENRFAYTYDKLNRLTGTEFFSDRGDLQSPVEWFTEKGMTYDLNGNIKTVNRFTEGVKDSLAMTYDGNRLTKVNNGTAFTYDANGNTMSDPIKNLEFQFNSLNLLDNVKKEGAMKARYIWGADGSKRAVADAVASNGFEYFGSFVFTKTSSGLESESAAFPEGRFMATSAISQGGSFSPIFHVTDHLGSVRAEIDGAVGTLRTVNDYMPYGTRFSVDGHGEQSRYQFSGKERQTVGTTGAANDMDLLDFGARMYDPTITRWLTQDPLAEKYYNTSPYVYCGGNPINRIDKDGRKWDNIQEAEALKTEIENRKTALKAQMRANEAKINNLSLSKKEVRKLNRENTELTAQVGRLDQSQANIDLLGADQKETYAFSQSPNGLGYVKKESDGKIHIYNDGSATKIHEITHVTQMYGSKSTTKLNPFGFIVQRVGDIGKNEIEAYKNQYSFSPASYPGRAKTIWDITETSISKIRDYSGQLVYPLLRK